jgi:magnesium chelatase accessory protein
MGLDHLPSDWPLREHSEFVHCEGTRWHVQRVGSGPVVLLLHGTGSSTHSMAGIAECLSAQFTCVLVDLPGQGFTPPIEEREHLLSAMARSICSLCKHLGLLPDYIIGHSAGAAVAIRMCLDQRRCRLCYRDGSASAVCLTGNSAVLSVVPLCGCP